LSARGLRAIRDRRGFASVPSRLYEGVQETDAELPGTARHDPLAYLQHRTVDWLDHQLAARELLDLDVPRTHLIVEHEFPGAKTQDRERLFPILQGSIAFVRRIDEAAACLYALQREVLPASGIEVQGRERLRG